MEQTANRINIVFYGDTEEDAIQLAQAVLGNRLEGQDVWTDTIAGRDVYGYIRYYFCSANASPKGVTDILVVKAEGSTSTNWSDVKEYVELRKGIPFKFLTGASNLTADAVSLGCEFIALAEIGNLKEKLVKSAIALEDTLKNAFNKIDVNGDGFISKDEILKASTELGHPLNDQDAFEIGKSLSVDGKISFAKFKEWWIFGRTDFNSFRKIVEIDLVVNNMIKQTSQTFNSYFDELQKEGKLAQSTEVGLSSKVNIGTTQDFQPGVGINIHLNAGNDFNGIIGSLPSYFSENPASFGLEIKLKSADQAEDVIQVLREVKLMLSDIPDVSQAFSLGVTVNFRHIGSSVFIDVSCGGLLGEKINSQISVFNFSTLNFTGSTDAHICSKLSPADLLTFDADSIVDAVSNLKIEGKGEYVQLKILINFIFNTITSLCQGNVPKEVLAAHFAFKFAAAIRKLNFEFKYDATTIKELIIQAINHAGHHNPTEEFPTRFSKKADEWNTQKQPELNGMVEQFSQMGSMFLEPFKDSILAADLDNLAIFAVCPVLKIHIKVGIQIRGVTEFVSKLF